MPGYFCYTLSLSVSLPLSLSVFEDTADCRQVCHHSWCLVISLLLFHLCYCVPLLTFQTNLVWQTDHRCPLDSSPLSEDSLAADLLFFVSPQIPIIPFLLLFVFSGFCLVFYTKVKTEHFCNVVPRTCKTRLEVLGTKYNQFALPEPLRFQRNWKLEGQGKAFPINIGLHPINDLSAQRGWEVLVLLIECH